MARRFLGLLSAALVGLYAAGAGAQEIFAPDVTGFNRIVGIAGAAVPDYEGSDDYTAVPAPIAMYRFHQKRYVQIVGNKVFVNVLNHENFEAGPLGVYRLGRDDVEDSAVDRMSDVDDAIELGGFVGYAREFGGDIRHRMNLHVDVTQDVASGHEGFVVELAGVYWRPVARPFDIGFRASVSYASDDYMSSYFDVSAADSARSGLSRFDADGGFKDVGLALMGLVHLSESWHVGLGLQYRRLLGDAADSPVVDDRGTENQFIAGLAVLYSW